MLDMKDDVHVRLFLNSSAMLLMIGLCEHMLASLIGYKICLGVDVLDCEVHIVSGIAPPVSTYAKHLFTCRTI